MYMTRLAFRYLIDDIVLTEFFLTSNSEGDLRFHHLWCLGSTTALRTRWLGSSKGVAPSFRLL